VKYKLKKGGQYTFEHVPFVKVEKPGHYRRSFTAPTAPLKLQRDSYSLVTN